MPDKYQYSIEGHNQLPAIESQIRIASLPERGDKTAKRLQHVLHLLGPPILMHTAMDPVQSHEFGMGELPQPVARVLETGASGWHGNKQGAGLDAAFLQMQSQFGTGEGGPQTLGQEHTQGGLVDHEIEGMPFVVSRTWDDRHQTRNRMPTTMNRPSQTGKPLKGTLFSRITIYPGLWYYEDTFS